MAKKEKRFVRVHSESSLFTDTGIIVDRQTGVNYLYAAGSYGGGVTPLLNRDGTPVITSVPREYE